MRQRMQSYLISLTAVSLALAGCSEAPDGDASGTMADSASTYESAAVQADVSADAMPGAAIPDLGALEVSMPKLAYTYAYAFRLGGEHLGDLQRRHADLCEQQGPAS